MAFLKDLWNFDPTTSPSLFYGSLSSLNEFYDTSLATPEILRSIQVEELRKIYKNKGLGYERLNEFLRTALGDTQGTENDLFAKLVNGINEGLDQFRNRENKINKNWNTIEYYNKLDDILSQITEIVNTASGGKGIPAPSLEPIKTAVGHWKYYDFIAAKGQYLEDLGAWIMEMAGLSGLSTGSWQAIDKFFDENAQKSLIEDAMGLVLGDSKEWKGSSNNFLQVQIQNYSKANPAKQQALNKELQNWINSIEGLNGAKVLDGKVTIGTNISSAEQFTKLIRLIENNPTSNIKISISLSENLYKTIQNLSVNIQAKSNVNRHLANAGNRSKYKMSFNDKYYNQLKRFSKMDPVVKQTAVTEKEQETAHEEFAAYVNYSLSKNINKTVYARNEFYLTKEGFTDLATLMEKRGFCIRIKNAVLSYKQFLENKFETAYDDD